MGEEGILNELGLTNAEIEVYKTLIFKGQLSVSKIANETKLNRSNLYKVLDNLTNKNLVASHIINNVKYYLANRPQNLINILNKKIENLNEKKKQLNKVIANFNKLIGFEKSELKVEIHRGIEEIKEIFENFLKSKNGEIIYSFGYEGIFKGKLKYYFKSFIKKRVKKRIKFKGIFNMHKNARKAQDPLTEVRYLNLKNYHKTEIALYKDNTIIFNLEGEPKAIVIKNKEITNHFKDYFNYLWENAIIP